MCSFVDLCLCDIQMKMRVEKLSGENVSERKTELFLWLRKKNTIELNYLELIGRKFTKTQKNWSQVKQFLRKIKEYERNGKGAKSSNLKYKFDKKGMRLFVNTESKSLLTLLTLYTSILKKTSQ